MSFGLSFATLFTTGWYVMGEISFLRPYSTFAWELYGVRSLFIATAFSVGVMWVFYTIAHALSLSDVGSRIATFSIARFVMAESGIRSSRTRCSVRSPASIIRDAAASSRRFRSSLLVQLPRFDHRVE